jgi:protoporphyrin/coproporphyrin ferrochelatase
MSFSGQRNYNHDGASPKTGVLLTNLGTPDAPTAKALRVYLKEFLSDPRVVEIPRLVWWLILHAFILTFRPAKSAKLYASIWSKEGSPLWVISQRQAEKLQQKLDLLYGSDAIPVAIGMRYGNPSIASAIDQLTQQNVRNLIVLPLYPQYSGATGGSTFDAVAQHLKNMRWVPELKLINGYHTHPQYLNALARSIEQHIQQHGRPDKLILSYHGTPQRYLEQGDPYSCFCQQTTRLLSEQLDYPSEDMITTFQSRFGKATWLQPYTDMTLKSLPDQNVKHIAVICPGFSVDCLETLEEIEAENREVFISAGGETFHYIPCLNDNSEHIEMMLQLVEQQLPLSFGPLKISL